MSDVIKVRKLGSSSEIEEVSLSIYSKDDFVELGPKNDRVFFWRHDTENIIQIKSYSTGKARYYRRESNLIVNTKYRGYAKKAETITNSVGDVLINPSYKSNWTKKAADGQYYDIQDLESFYPYSPERSNDVYVCHRKWPRLNLVTNGQPSKYPVRVEDVIKLDESFYGKNVYAFPLDVEEFEGRNVVKDDLTLTLTNDDKLKETIVPQSKRRAGNIIVDVAYAKTRSDVVKLTKDKSWATIGHENTIVFRYAVVTGTYPPVPTTRLQQVGTSAKLGYRIWPKKRDEIIDKYNSYREEINRIRFQSLKLDFQSNFSDQDETENQAPKIISAGQHAGGQHIFVSSSKSAVISKATDLTGGLGYTFGVEIETSGGMVPTEQVSKLDIDQVGDRSIGSAEYVTGVLHGNDGMKRMENIMQSIQDYCLVDDRCSIHVHVGTMNREGVTPLTFDTDLAVKMIKLGAAIESSLFLSLPPSRRTTMRYCHGISAYSDITKSNWEDYLGCYIFGSRVDSQLNENRSAYTFGVNNPGMDATLSKYHTGGRYKWLNLVHAVTRSYVRTIEFRAFSGTTNIDKVRNYILLSLALVDYANKHTLTQIKKSTSIYDVIDFAFNSNKEILTSVKSFYENRTKKFNRKNID